MDSANARTDFLLGELHLARGDTSGGREFFDRARDEDLLKFRAPSSINATIRDVCSSCGVPFVSADSALSAASPGGITGPTLFWEHLHLRLDGYYRIADLFLKELLLRRLAPSPNPEQAFASRIPCNPDSLSVCWLDEAIADLSIEGLTGRWPFNAFRPAPLVFNGADTALQHIALEVYGRQLGWNEGCVQTAAWFVAHGKPGPARTTYEAILEEYPRAYLVRYLLANLLKERGNLDQAREQYARVIAANNSYPYAHVELGLLLINAGEFRRADAELKTGLEQAMRTDAPASLKATAMYGLAAIAANRRSFDEALFLLDGSLQFSPSYQPAHDLRRQILIARKYREPKH
jgi:tetratricopeptide (TPR) repeat protein